MTPGTIPTASFDAARACEPTLCRAAHSAERTAYEISKGKPFNCVRGQGRLTVDQCLTRFLGGHEVCARDCGCSLDKRAVEKANTVNEGVMSYKDTYGDCACGKKSVKLDQ